MTERDTVLWDWPHRDDVTGISFQEALSRERPLVRLLGRMPIVRGAVLWSLARRHTVTVIGFAGNATRAFLLLERLFGDGRRYLVVLHFIPETTLRKLTGWRDLSSLQYWVRAVKLPYLRWVVKPALQRSLLRCQVLTAWEMERDAAFFELAPGRMCLLKYPLRTEDDVLPANGEREGVMVSGRAACDWPTVFAMAGDAPWPLTLVCGERESREVMRLNRHARARVLVDISPEEHFRLLSRAAVYVLALHDVEASSGQIRLSDAVRAGTPVVASQTVGIAEYIDDGRAALSFAPGDAMAARAHVHSLLADRELCARRRALAFESAGEWTRESYRAAMQQMVLDALREASEHDAATLQVPV